MQRGRSTSLNVLPNEELEASKVAQLVINTYTTTMALTRDERRAFGEAVRAWRERNPDASPERGRAAVATIICRKL